MKRYNTGLDRKIVGSVIAALVISFGIVASTMYVPSESRSDLRFETSEILILFGFLIVGFIFLITVNLVSQGRVSDSK